MRRLSVPSWLLTLTFFGSILPALVCGPPAALAQSGTWHQVTFTAPDPTPSGRMYFGYVHDSARDRLLVFGGHPTYLNDLWAFSLATGKWTAVAPAGAPPSPRWGHTAIYDPARDRVVVFGGIDGAERNDTWVLDLASNSWSQAATSGVTPAARRNHTAIYDPVNDQMIVFGGFDGAQFRDDVQALSLASMTWSDIDPIGPTPDERDLMTAVYDPDGARMVLFGGWDSSKYLNDIWMLELGPRPRWEKIQRLRTPHSVNPGVRRDYSAAYDPIGKRMLVFGGTDGSYFGDVWALRLDVAEMWEPVNTSGAGPTPRHSAGAIFDPGRNELVIVGGYDSNYRADVGRLDLGSGTWSLVPETHAVAAPTPRRDYASGLDAAHDRMLYFGGQTASGDVRDLWALSLGSDPAWTRVHNGVGVGPSARHGAVGFVDAPSGDFYVFGGVDLSVYNNDLWRWNESSGWSLVPVAGVPPSGRMYMTIVYDAARDRYVVFGGHPSFLNDVWVLSLRPSPTWTLLATVGTPPSPRYNHAAVMDAVHDRMIVYGGVTSSGDVGNTLALNFAGTPSWQNIPPAGSTPGPRRLMAHDVDTARQRMVIFGGYNGSAFVNTTYALSLNTGAWTQLAPGGSTPAVRDLMTIHYDASRDNFVLFGGFNPGGFLDDVWTLGSFGASPALEARRVTFSSLSLRAENPVRGTGIRFSLALPAAGDADVELIDVTGRRVMRQTYAGLSAGLHRVEMRGTRVSPGVYFARVTLNGETAMTRVAVVR